MNSSTGFLLSFIRYGDNDCIVHCFTKENGFQSYFLRGIYASKNKKKAFLFPLNELSLTVNTKKSTMPLISKMELEKLSCPHENVKTYSTLLFVADFLNQVLKNEPSNPNLYQEIQQFLEELNRQNYISHLIFLMNFLKIIGVAPLISEKPYLNPEIGEFEENQSHSLFTSEIGSIWKQVLTSKNPYQTQLDLKFRRLFLESVMSYYQHHITNFTLPFSLEVLKEVHA